MPPSNSSPSTALNDEAVSHDKLFKTAFQFFLKNLVELVHPEFADNFDLEHPRFLTEDLFADLRKEGHLRPDLVAEVKNHQGESQLVLLHIEIEGRFRRDMDRRMYQYSMHLHLTSGKPVLSLVVFLQGGHGGIQVREVTQVTGSFEVWRFRYFAFGLSKSLAEDYVDRPQPLSAALAALMRSKIWDRVEQKLRCLRSISQAQDLIDSEQFILAKIVQTYLPLNVEEKQRFELELKREANKEVQEMVITWEEALAESKSEGRVEGRVEGRAEATRDAIFLLARRFKMKIPKGFQERVEAISDLDQLQRLIEQILDGKTVEELDLS